MSSAGLFAPGPHSALLPLMACRRCRLLAACRLASVVVGRRAPLSPAARSHTNPVLCGWVGAIEESSGASSSRGIIQGGPGPNCLGPKCLVPWSQNLYAMADVHTHGEASAVAAAAIARNVGFRRRVVAVRSNAPPSRHTAAAITNLQQSARLLSAGAGRCARSRGIKHKARGRKRKKSEHTRLGTAPPPFGRGGGWLHVDEPTTTRIWFKIGKLPGLASGVGDSRTGDGASIESICKLPAATRRSEAAGRVKAQPNTGNYVG